MLAVLRFRQHPASADEFRDRLRSALDVLGGRRGFVRGHVARAADDPGLWVLVTEWEGAGAYRRALSSYEVKVQAVPVLSQALDEAGAFEVVDTLGSGTSHRPPAGWSHRGQADRP